MTALAPVAWQVVSRKLKRYDVPPLRMQERLGHASLPRPKGPLVWFHGASVGESLSVLTLIDALKGQRPDLNILMTSGTATSAEILAKRMPAGCQHQFAPLDAIGPVDRFLDYWHPDAGIFVDSEIWPNMLVRARAAGVRLALVNARLSQKSVEGWKKYPATSAFVLDQFDLILTQNRQNADYMREMGADEARVKSGVNLKAMAKPLPVDELELARLRGQIGDRPIWVAASTHKGEEETILAAHAKLLQQVPDALLVLVPRHPERGDEVAQLIAMGSRSVVRRSKGETPRADTDILLADTLGEMGLWYALSDIVFVGGSLRAIGGHNPFEVASAGGVVLSGPHVSNFAETYEAMERIGAARLVESSEEIAKAVQSFIEDPKALEAAKTAGHGFVSRYGDKLEEMVSLIMEKLNLNEGAAP
ncbi:3-deoxy-D-manno-octulosonic acid transferase [Aestuariivita boseongensis]|uniref:3-deoxy-D-manno-octulosonic acid transferase n=1 Tax=Aestuariivita boseongensis TaxID=1470562 RepID=UPI001FE04AEB|nr:3-deoxy-D-manno-octulosonic acid transferase [Aestuariivita boseongensis]